ncbi:MAG: type II toxin-antitoxin system HicA family toxin [Iphinoe sp. HA4291-MV1]|jgi:predicted RNA binding protein YcfA (HicA-like mRNA interferase family)|nr:type II toxin-antitoxin system HicA family toxin [Iphinoe sp. HA4291-MV1]
MSERIRRMTARVVESILRQYGFQLISQKGSHRKWRNEDLGLQVIVPEHRGRTLPIGTLRSIFQGAKIPESGWRG